MTDSISRKIYKTLMLCAIYLSVITVSLVVVFLIVHIVSNALLHISYDLIFSAPSYLDETIGLMPDILNTVYIIVTAVFLVVPTGVGAAIYLNEYAASKKTVRIIEYAIETLSGIPSIIYGLVGMLIFVQFIGLKTSILAGSLTLMIMSLPTIIRTTQESLRSVPDSYRHGAYALGADKFYVIKSVIVPVCTDGIAAGCILATGRMLGESAALLFTAGFAHNLNGYFAALSQSGSTLSVALYVYAKEQGEFEVAFVIAFILLMLCLLINLLSSFTGRRIKNKTSGTV